MVTALNLVERGLLPDAVVRAGIRRLCQQRLRDEYSGEPEKQGLRYQELLSELKRSEIALETDAANEQHYEVPTGFYQIALGKHLKYSACYWDETTKNLDQAEALSLQLSAQRAELADGQEILELGCGWGSFTLWMAEHFPASSITAVSNSNTQREHILREAKFRGLSNIRVITEDVNVLTLDQRFDRVVSIEMFEHMRNYSVLLERISHWLKDDGKLWVHIFCHRYLMYPFETVGDDNWMGKYFFTGGLMPAFDTLLNFPQHLHCEQRWAMPGTHYQRTAEAWLGNMDNEKSQVMELFRDAYGKKNAAVWYNRWRIFFMSCAELFAYNHGNDWLVGHYRFVKQNNES